MGKKIQNNSINNELFAGIANAISILVVYMDSLEVNSVGNVALKNHIEKTIEMLENGIRNFK